MQELIEKIMALPDLKPETLKQKVVDLKAGQEDKGYTLYFSSEYGYGVYFSEDVSGKLFTMSDDEDFEETLQSLAKKHNTYIVEIDIDAEHFYIDFDPAECIGETIEYFEGEKFWFPKHLRGTAEDIVKWSQNGTEGKE